MKIILPAVLVAVLVAVSSSGATISASSPSWVDVSNAVASASNGDSVIIPSGTATWESTLTVGKAISVFGSGTNSTHITRTNGTIIQWSIATNIPIRISAIQFTGGWNDPILAFAGKTESGSGTEISSFRVDRCKFNFGKRAVYPYGWAYGVIDNCTFVNCNIAIAPQGDNTAAWNRSRQYGTTNAVVIESNVFIVTDDAPSTPNEQIYHQNGAVSATRYNVFSGIASTNYDFLPFESHGNFGSGVVDPATTNALYYRGQPVVEVYANQINARQTYRFIYLRGGSVVCMSNSMSYTHGGAPYGILLTEEETWQTSLFSPLKTTRYDNDSITNSFFWGNTINGSQVDPVVVGPSTNVLSVNSEYWLESPNATNGSPSGILSGYAPLVYPHPRVTAEDGRVFSATTARVGTIRSP